MGIIKKKITLAYAINQDFAAYGNNLFCFSVSVVFELQKCQGVKLIDRGLRLTVIYNYNIEPHETATANQFNRSQFPIVFYRNFTMQLPQLLSQVR